MQGIGEFYGGILHPIVVPAHVLALVMLGLLAGQRGMAAVRRTYLGAFACLLLVADLSERAAQGWQRTGLRVLGSWGAASATLVYAMRWLVP